MPTIEEAYAAISQLLGGSGPKSAIDAGEGIMPEGRDIAAFGPPSMSQALTSSEGDELAAMSPIEALKLRLQLAERAPVTPEQRRANLATTGQDVLSVMPIIGNAMSAVDAGEAGGRAAAAFQGGDTRQGLMQSALAALAGAGAFMGLPTGRAAGRAADAGRTAVNTFVPVEEGLLSGRARDMRDAGASNRQVFDDTGLLFGGDGSMRRWIPDNRMDIDFSHQPGDVTTVGQLVNHPTLFREMPALQNRIVRVTDKAETRPGQPPRGISRTDPETGDFEFSVAGSHPYGDMAKLLQYDINDAAGWSSAGRHNFQDQLADINTAQVQAMLFGGGGDAARAYTRTLDDVKADIAKQMAKRERFQTMSRSLTDKTAGSVDSKIVRAMADTPSSAPMTYPYGPGASWVRGNYTPPAFSEMLSLPPAQTTADDWQQFLADWRRYGSGRGD